MIGLNENAEHDLGMDFGRWCEVASPLLCHERQLLEAIEVHKNEIDEWRKKPRHKSEILSEIQRVRALEAKARLEAVRSALMGFQTGKIDALEGLQKVGIRLVAGRPEFAVGGLNGFQGDVFDDEIVKNALGGMPEGVTEKERNKAIEKLEGAIVQLRERITLECWPNERRFFDDRGRPLPGRDRWQEFLSLWQHINNSYCCPVDPRGNPLKKGTAPWSAFHELNMQNTGATDPRTICGRSGGDENKSVVLR